MRFKEANDEVVPLTLTYDLIPISSYPYLYLHLLRIIVSARPSRITARSDGKRVRLGMKANAGYTDCLTAPGGFGSRVSE